MDSFWFGCDLTDFLVPDFDINSVEGMIAVCFGTVMLVLLYEYLKTNRMIKKLKLCSMSKETSIFKLAFSVSSEKSNLINRQETAKCRNYREIWKINDIFIHFFELIVGYLLMTIAMTYNGYLMVAIGVGSLFGYLLYGSVLFNIAAQMVVQRIMCTSCEIKRGDTTPIISENSDNELAGPSNDDRYISDIKDESYTVVQIHSS
ncbi:hypothetical protein PGB90_003727 [Kerria lacca]